jgi:heme/copper-type cytochrome/quinol oxidase subunit 2
MRLAACGLWLAALALSSSSSLESSFLNARGAPPPLARAPALPESLSSRGPRALQARPVVVTIEAERFAFSPSEVKVNAGETIEFRLKSSDTDHGFRILDTDINVTIPKRGKGTTTVTFTPKKPGRYTFECSRVCGAGHSFMRGTLVVK